MDSLFGFTGDGFVKSLLMPRREVARRRDAAKPRRAISPPFAALCCWRQTAPRRGRSSCSSTMKRRCAFMHARAFSSRSSDVRQHTERRAGRAFQLSCIFSLLTCLQIKDLDSHKMIAAAGPQADTVRFVEYIQRNIALHSFRTGASGVQRHIVAF